ncbi:5-methylcytosine-specific restriction endonuclease system specificity protein McrC [Dialister sp.]|jgi:5-methylcytosine-specific restriction enzyme subunit McrC|uniref:5-methylcytosine-specific restriction endonuclease system specificity protein McrC n=1 Tax=Dialister sp. TaxID=1955814 RepID=UPI003A5C2A18
MTRYGNILIKNIYYMLSYVLPDLRRSVYLDLEKEPFDNIYSLFAGILEKGVSYQLKQGLYREYEEKREDMAAVRGRIYMPGTMGNRMRCRRLVTCDYDELTVDGPMNRVLKTVLAELVRDRRVDKERRARLKKELPFFASISLIDLRQVRWDGFHFHRNNRNYELLMAICRLLVEGSILTTGEGARHLPTFDFEDELSRIYEKFLLNYYKQEYERKYPGFTAGARTINWDLDDGNRDLLPSMNTDVTLSMGDKILILDAKFYQHTLQEHHDNQSQHSHNMYQIFAYVKNEAANEGEKTVAGMLLYARTDEEVLPDAEYRMSGNRISVKSLDLNRDFSEIRRTLNGIAEEYFGIG